ncbi:SAM-dependent methyltransferase [Streptomyces sp. NPDC059650]|uniref:SAM-dependent methyltransferase n=1 Tax=Streptomyces sp. NPDC059650 TaxID=3346896 RepID=UPI00369EF3F1
MRSGDEHYRDEDIGRALGLPGAGILAWLTADQLHPPMLNDDAMWRDGNQWKWGACRYVAELGSLAGIQPGDKVLDIGCGLCGPARLLVDNFGASVTAITNSKAHAATSQELNSRNARHCAQITVQHVQGIEYWPDGPYSAAWSLNMLYQVPDHQELFGKVCNLLRPGGRFLLDDWMATDSITECDLQIFRHHFQYRNLLKVSSVESELIAAGFYPAERMVDRGQVGRGPMKQHFETVMREHFLPKISEAWPDDCGVAVSGNQMVKDFTEAVGHTLDLYSAGKLTYRTLVAGKR